MSILHALLGSDQAFKAGAQIFEGANDWTGPHVPVRLALQEFGDAVRYFLGQTG